MKVFQLIHCVLKPLLVRDRNSCFHVSDGSRRHEAAVPRIAGNAHQIVLVGLVEKIHLLIQPLGGQVLVLDDTVVHGIGDPAHAAQIILQIDCCLFQQLAGVFPHQCLLFLGKLLVKQDTQKTQTAYRNDRK